MRKFVGVIPLVVTAFDSNRKLDLERTKEFIRHLISKGVSGIFIAGSTGGDQVLLAGGSSSAGWSQG